MKNENGTPHEISLSDFRGIVVAYGLILVWMASRLTRGLLFAEHPEGITFPSGLLEGAGCGLYLTASWLLTTPCFLLGSRRRRLQQANRWCHTAACVTLVLCLLTFALRDILDPEAVKSLPLGEEAPTPLRGAFLLVAAVLWVTTAGPGHRRGAAESSGELGTVPSPRLGRRCAWYSPLRPLRAIFNVPVLGSVVFTAFCYGLVAFLFVGAEMGAHYIAERVGTCFANPDLGVRRVSLFVVMALPVLVIGYANMACENERERDDDQRRRDA